MTVTRWDRWREGCVTATLTQTWAWLQDSAAAKPTSKAYAATTARRATTVSARTTHWAVSVCICVFSSHWEDARSKRDGMLVFLLFFHVTCIHVRFPVSLQLRPSWHHFDGSSLWSDQWGLLLQKICYRSILQPVSGEYKLFYLL